MVFKKKIRLSMKYGYHILIAILFSIFSYSCKNDLKNLKEKHNAFNLNAERAEEVSILYGKDGVTKAKLYTKSFQHIQNVTPSYIEMKENLRVDFYNDSLQIQSTLTAKYGKYFEQDGNVLVRDSVKVVNLKNEQLETEELIWNEKIQKFYTEKFVKITTPTQVIYGDGLESNQNFSEYKIINVKGIIGISQNSFPGL